MNEINLENISTEYDMVIVGAGPAGCILTNYLSKEYKVLLVEKSSIPRTKPCGGMLVEESQEIIKKLDPPNYIFSNPKNLDLEYADYDNNIRKKLNRKFLNVYRGPFDYWLFKLLDKKPHDFISNAELMDFEIKNGGVKLKIKNETTKEIKTKYLVGADGARSLIRSKIGQPIKHYLAIQKYYETGSLQLDHATFIFNNSITDFYSWIIPKQLYFVIGSALPLQNAHERFRQFEKSISKTIQLTKNIEMEAALISRPQSEKDIFLGQRNILLLGEAAGFISPSFGEGISFALRSAQNLAKIFNENFDTPYANYLRLCKPLIEEVKDKIKKAELISNPNSRINFFKE